MDTKDIQVEYIETDKLIPYANNARIHGDADVDAIMASIEEFGFTNPILTWNGIICAGHGRLLAAKRLGMPTVPVIALDYLTDDQRRAYILADNKTAELSSWDFDLVEAELKAITDIDMNQFGFNAEAAGIASPQEAADDHYTPEIPEEPESKPGEIYQLGKHRLMCGDSSNPDDMAALFGDIRANMVFTDPPYGVAIGSKNRELNETAGKGGRVQQDIANDTLDAAALRTLLTRCMSNLREHCADDCSYYVTSPQGGDIGSMMGMMQDAGLAVRHNLIWVKNQQSFSMGRLDYDYKHEPIFYTWTKSHHFYGGYETSVIDDSQPIDKMSKSELKELVRALQSDHEQSVIYCDKPQRSDLHPTMKPVPLIGRFVVNSSQRDDVVADIFGGSGSTLIACQQLDRTCYMMELDPRYVDVIIDRWEKFTGEKAVLINGQKEVEEKNQKGV